MSNSYSFARLKSELETQDVQGLQEAGLLRPQAAGYLEDYAQNYEPNSESHYEDDGDAYHYYNSRKYVEIVRRELNETLYTAVKRGNAPIIERAMGLQQKNNSLDVADWNEYEKIKDMIRDEPRVTELTNNVFQSVIYSSAVPPTGRGKSNTAYTLSEMFKTVDPNLTTITNNKSDPFETLPEHWSDVEERIREINGQILLILDEAAQFLQYADQTAGMSVSKMLKLLRKHNANIIFIGHTGMDIPADIRRQMFFIDKISQKKAVVGYGIEASKDGTMKVANRLFKLDNIPETSVDYDDIGDVGIEIKFGEDEDDEEKDVGKSQKEIIKDMKDNTCKDCSNEIWHGLPFCYAHARKHISQGDYKEFDLDADELEELEEEMD